MLVFCMDTKAAKGSALNVAVLTGARGVWKGFALGWWGTGGWEEAKGFDGAEGPGADSKEELVTFNRGIDRRSLRPLLFLTSFWEAGASWPCAGATDPCLNGATGKDDGCDISSLLKYSPYSSNNSVPCVFRLLVSALSADPSNATRGSKLSSNSHFIGLSKLSCVISIKAHWLELFDDDEWWRVVCRRWWGWCVTGSALWWEGYESSSLVLITRR